MPHIEFRWAGAALVAALAGTSGLAAQDQPAAPDALQQRLTALEAQLGELKDQVQRSNDATAALGASLGKLQGQQDVDNGFAWGGFLDVTLGVQRTTPDAPAGRTASVAFNPILIYNWREDWLAVAELNISSDSGETTSELGQAFLSYTALPHAVIQAGLAPVPFAAYSERYSPTWINKASELPPIAYNETCGLFASDLTDYELAVRGDIPLDGNRRIDWFAFVGQGPSYNSDDGSDDRLAFGANSGPGHHTPSLGGRIAYLPHPGAEIGLSLMGGGIANNNTAYSADSRRQFVSYAVDVEGRFAGAILRGEWAALRYDTSDDRRIQSQAGYLQLSQRLRWAGGNWGNVEPILRFGELTRSGTVTADADYRKVTEYTAGVNYYHTSYIRTSLMADVYSNEARPLDRIVLDTTFAF